MTAGVRAPEPLRVDAAAARAAARAAAIAAGGPVLALDTSTDAASLALASEGAVHERHLAARVAPSEAVMPALVALLEAAQLVPGKLRALVVGLGPGSFTGLRVGLATLKGLGYAAGVPLYGVSSLGMLAAAAGLGRVAVVRDARRGSAYLGAYAVDPDGTVDPLAPDACVPVAALPARLAALGGTAKLLRVGDAASLPLALGLTPLPAPQAVLLVAQAAARLARGDCDELASLAPAYLQAMVPPLRAGS